MQPWVTPWVSVLSALLGSCVGGFVVHRLSLARELRGARREQRVAYLVSAYRQLIEAANRPGPPGSERVARLEAAISDVVLLGEREEIKAVERFISEMAEHGVANLDDVLDALRTSLRRELELPEVEHPAKYSLRIHD